MELLPTTVLRKTPLGISMLKVHDRSLDQKSRTLLILMNGVKTVQELSSFSPDPTQIPILLQLLLDAGLVSVGVEAAAPTAGATPHANLPNSQPPSAATQSAAPTIQQPVDLKTAIRKATRALENLLGPSSEVLCLQIEKCKSMPELIAKVQDLRSVVARLQSAKKADDFVQAALGA
jgi:hypothetical protein